MVKYRHHVPIIDYILNELHESYVFSKIDLTIGYYRIKMKVGDEGEK
jgi:hypothetical protein